MADQVGVRTQRTGTLGCIGCNAFVGPGFADTDLGLQEDLPIARGFAIRQVFDRLDTDGAVQKEPEGAATD